MLNRRFMMSQATPSGGGVVQNGLLVHLDGTNKGDTPNVWKDLQGNMDFEYNNLCIPTEKGLDISNDISNLKCPKAIIPLLVSGTVEIVLNPKGFLERAPRNVAIATSNWTLEQQFFVGWFKGSNFIIGSRKSGMPDLPTFDVPLIKNQIMTISVTKDSVFYNKTKAKKELSSYFTPFQGNQIWLGKYGDNFGTELNEVFAFRYYDRVLSTEEILQNQQHDIDTYFGGVL